jgi:hypothetical protein
MENAFGNYALDCRLYLDKTEGLFSKFASRRGIGRSKPLDRDWTDQIRRWGRTRKDGAGAQWRHGGDLASNGDSSPEKRGKGPSDHNPTNREHRELEGMNTNSDIGTGKRTNTARSSGWQMANSCSRRRHEVSKPKQEEKRKGTRWLRKTEMKLGINLRWGLTRRIGKTSLATVL